MSTRKMLFLVLPLLFIFNNAVSSFILYNSQSIAKSYHMVLNRVLLYQDIEKHIQHHVNITYQYILDPADELFSTVIIEREELKVKSEQLDAISSVEHADLSLLRYKNLIQSFLNLEEALFTALQMKSTLSYATIYDQLNLISTFITEESSQLIGLELSTYQKWYNHILIEIEQIQLSGITLLIVNTLISLLLAYLISIRISKPIEKLVSVAEHISNGELSTVTPTFPNHSEFNILSEAFAQMQVNVKLLFDKEKEALEKDKLLTELELEVLQNQINPHFLFNSLNILSKLALIEGAEKTSDLTVSLSNLFRYNLKQLDRPVPLRDEVEHAKEYFYIQQARFRERVKFFLEVDSDQLDTLVPVLTLQPMLENIFVHGIEGLERPAEISLKISGDELYAYIEISDNGVGMDEATRQALLEYDVPKRNKASNEQSKHSTGIGTRNVFRRLELLYQKNDLVKIESKPNIGTSVTIRIPKHSQEVDYVSNINRR